MYSRVFWSKSKFVLVEYLDIFKTNLSERQWFGRGSAGAAHALFDQSHREFLMGYAVFGVAHVFGLFVGYMVVYAQQYVFLKTN